MRPARTPRPRRRGPRDDRAPRQHLTPEVTAFVARLPAAGLLPGGDQASPDQTNGGVLKKRVFFLTHLKDGADVDEYERFLREIDYPLSMELLPISYYRATRLEGQVIAAAPAPYAYLEVLDIDDYEAYLAAFASPSPEVADLIAKVFSYVDDRTALALFGEIVQ